MKKLRQKQNESAISVFEKKHLTPKDEETMLEFFKRSPSWPFWLELTKNSNELLVNLGRGMQMKEAPPNTWLQARGAIQITKQLLFILTGQVEGIYEGVYKKTQPKDDTDQGKSMLNDPNLPLFSELKISQTDLDDGTIIDKKSHEILHTRKGKIYRNFSLADTSYLEAYLPDEARREEWWLLRLAEIPEIKHHNKRCKSSEQLTHKENQSRKGVSIRTPFGPNEILNKELLNECKGSNCFSFKTTKLTSYLSLDAEHICDFLAYRCEYFKKYDEFIEQFCQSANLKPALTEIERMFMQEVYLFRPATREGDRIVIPGQTSKTKSIFLIKEGSFDLLVPVKSRGSMSFQNSPFSSSSPNAAAPTTAQNQKQIIRVSNKKKPGEIPEEWVTKGNISSGEVFGEEIIFGKTQQYIFSVKQTTPNCEILEFHMGGEDMEECTPPGFLHFLKSSYQHKMGLLFTPDQMEEEGEHSITSRYAPRDSHQGNSFSVPSEQRNKTDEIYKNNESSFPSNFQQQYDRNPRDTISAHKSQYLQLQAPKNQQLQSSFQEQQPQQKSLPQIVYKLQKQKPEKLNTVVLNEQLNKNLRDSCSSKASSSTLLNQQSTNKRNAYSLNDSTELIITHRLKSNKFVKKQKESQPQQQQQQLQQQQQFSNNSSVISERRSSPFNSSMQSSNKMRNIGNTPTKQQSDSSVKMVKIFFEHGNNSSGSSSNNNTSNDPFRPHLCSFKAIGQQQLSESFEEQSEGEGPLVNYRNMPCNPLTRRRRDDQSSSKERNRGNQQFGQNRSNSSNSSKDNSFSDNNASTSLSSSGLKLRSVSSGQGGKGFLEQKKKILENEKIGNAFYSERATIDSLPASKIRKISPEQKRNTESSLQRTALIKIMYEIEHQKWLKTQQQQSHQNQESQESKVNNNFAKTAEPTFNQINNSQKQLAQANQTFPQNQQAQKSSENTPQYLSQKQTQMPSQNASKPEKPLNQQIQPGRLSNSSLSQTKLLPSPQRHSIRESSNSSKSISTKKVVVFQQQPQNKGILLLKEKATLNGVQKVKVNNPEYLKIKVNSSSNLAEHSKAATTQENILKESSKEEEEPLRSKSQFFDRRKSSVSSKPKEKLQSEHSSNHMNSSSRAIKLTKNINSPSPSSKEKAHPVAMQKIPGIVVSEFQPLETILEKKTQIQQISASSKLRSPSVLKKNNPLENAKSSHVSPSASDAPRKNSFPQKKIETMQKIYTHKDKDKPNKDTINQITNHSAGGLGSSYPHPKISPSVVRKLKPKLEDSKISNNLMNLNSRNASSSPNSNRPLTSPTSTSNVKSKKVKKK